jgi:streptothricin acetyltransferase
MKITIDEINARNVSDVGKCDAEFTIDSKLILQVVQGQISYSIQPLPMTKKRYAQDDIDYTVYINASDKTVFFAYLEGRLAGQIILRKNWNQYAYIEDIAVDAGFRRRGVGRALIKQAMGWSHERNLAGIMLETQDNNLSACKFYERCGFQLAGFDRDLYKGINPHTDEVALYWYLLF